MDLTRSTSGSNADVVRGGQPSVMQVGFNSGPMGQCSSKRGGLGWIIQADHDDSATKRRSATFTVAAVSEVSVLCLWWVRPTRSSCQRSSLSLEADTHMPAGGSPL
jgi:hypothetical protein